MVFRLKGSERPGWVNDNLKGCDNDPREHGPQNGSVKDSLLNRAVRPAK